MISFNLFFNFFITKYFGNLNFFTDKWMSINLIPIRVRNQTVLNKISCILGDFYLTKIYLFFLNLFKSLLLRITCKRIYSKKHKIENYSYRPNINFLTLLFCSANVQLFTCLIKF